MRRGESKTTMTFVSSFGTRVLKPSAVSGDLEVESSDAPGSSEVVMFLQGPEAKP